MTSRLRILWIDEQLAGIRRFIDVLEVYGHDVVTKTNASDALDEIRANHDAYDVVIIDVMLPAGGQKVLFPNGETDEGLSTGVLLIEHIISGDKNGGVAAIPDIQRKIIIFSGASIERITAKIERIKKQYVLPYREKGVRNDVVEFAEYVEKHVSARRESRS